MEHTSRTWQLPSGRPRDLALLDSGIREQSQWPATNPGTAGIRLLTAANGVQLQRGADVYAMSTMAMAAKAIQGDHIAVGGVHVTDIKFFNRLGPPPLSPPV